MKKILEVLGIVFGGLFVLAVFYALFFGSIFGITKTIEILKIETGLTKAVWTFFYFAIIWIVYTLSKSLVKSELIVKGNVNFKGELIKDRNLDFNVKRVRIVYNLFVIICLAFLIYGFSMYLHFDFVFTLFLILPVALIGINNGINEVVKMTYEEKEKYIYEQKEYASKDDY